MIHLNPQSIKISKAKSEFHFGMINFVIDRLDKLREEIGANADIVERLFNIYIIPNLDEILVGYPNDLFKINSYINPFINSIPDLKKGIKHVFNYDLFTKKAVTRYDAYDLAVALDVNTCVYCNRNYTTTVIKDRKKKIARPQFDHYFDKGTNPLLAISFYNLIPSCSTCNSGIKGIKPMMLDEHLHPYIDDNINDISFSYELSTKTKTGLRIKVNCPRSLKAKTTLELFAIEEIYNSHTSELLDLLKIRQHFSDRYLSILSSNLLKDVIVSKEDLYRIVFGTEFDSAKFVNRPFSKFKYDILKELGII